MLQSVPGHRQSVIQNLFFHINTKVPGHRNLKGGREQKWNFVETRGTDTHSPTLFSLTPLSKSVYQQQNGCKVDNTYYSLVDTALAGCCSIDSVVSWSSIGNPNNQTDQSGDCNVARDTMSGNSKLKKTLQARFIPIMAVYENVNFVRNDGAERLEVAIESQNFTITSDGTFLSSDPKLGNVNSLAPYTTRPFGKMYMADCLTNETHPLEIALNCEAALLLVTQRTLGLGGGS